MGTLQQIESLTQYLQNYSNPSPFGSGFAAAQAERWMLFQQLGYTEAQANQWINQYITGGNAPLLPMLAPAQIEGTIDVPPSTRVALDQAVLLELEQPLATLDPVMQPIIGISPIRHPELTPVSDTIQNILSSNMLPILLIGGVLLVVGKKWL